MTEKQKENSIEKIMEESFKRFKKRLEKLESKVNICISNLSKNKDSKEEVKNGNLS